MSDTSKQVIPLSKPDVTEAEIEAVVQVLRTDRLSIGPHLEAFEAALAQRAGRKHGIGVNSGTSGLHLCVKSLGISEGDEVITTPFSFIATTNAILFESARPVFVDIDPETYNLDPTGIEAAITPRTKAILPVEVFGNTAHFDQYELTARRNGLRMIEDCCEALGGHLGDRPAGSFGDCGVFGFYPNKQITTGEGGMIVTDSDQTAQMCRALRNQGRTDGSAMPHPMLGYNYRMGELTAALGQGQVTRLEEILGKRRRAAAVYSSILADIEEIHLPKMAQPDKAAWFVYVVRLDDSFTAEQRDDLVDQLGRCGVSCKAYFSPIHLQPFIRDRLGTKPGDFPQTERIAARTICLPFFTKIQPEEMQRVRQSLLESLGRRDRACLGVKSKPPDVSDQEPARALAKRIRMHAVRMTHSSRASHVASSLSMADLLAVLYSGILRVRPDCPEDPDRDRFILSKGHGCVALYAVLAEKGFFPLEWLDDYYVDGSRLPGHATHWGVPGVEISTGSLGHGLAMAAGMALAGKLDGRPYRVFALLSDGECDEGSTWEAVLFAPHHRLDNLVAIVDYNKIQSLGHVKNILDLEPFADKWRSFGWAVREVDGHNVGEVAGALRVLPWREGRPTCLIAHTVKGKGVSFMEDDVLWHYRAPDQTELKGALDELGCT